MEIQKTALPGVLVIEPRAYVDQRGFFYESFNLRKFEELTDISPRFVQDNHSKSSQYVLRGLHYQIRRPQGKLVRVVAGEIFDVAVDIRRSSDTFGRWIGMTLSAENRRQLWVPPGFAHGFVVLSPSVELLYKTTDYWAPEHERAIIWNDPTVGIEWPISQPPLLSTKDQAARPLTEAEVFE
jgi:dTDP-4-dehydrorhamnose 3,5-epimerase